MASDAADGDIAVPVDLTDNADLVAPTAADKPRESRKARSRNSEGLALQRSGKAETQ